MKKIKLIGIDLDGTLISKFKKISKKNALSIKKAIDNGISCAIITGRSIVSSKKIKDELDFKTQSIGRFLVSFNGSSIIDFYENKTYETFIDSKIAKEIHHLSLNWKLNSWYYTKEATLNGAVEVEGYKPFLLTKIFKNLNLKKVTNSNKLSSYKIYSPSFSPKIPFQLIWVNSVCAWFHLCIAYWYLLSIHKVIRCVFPGFTKSVSSWQWGTLM